MATAALRHCTTPLLVVRDANRLFQLEQSDGTTIRALVSLALDDTDVALTEALALVASTSEFAADFVHFQFLPDSHPERVYAKLIREREARERLGDMPKGVALGSVLIHDGSVGLEHEIRNLTLARHADLVVCGSHRRHGLARLRGGSTAEEIVMHSPVSVLVARAPVAADDRGFAFSASDLTP